MPENIYQITSSDQQTKIGKSSQIEFWRIVFTIGVALLHFGYINGFYIAVDFFFMLTGFLSYRSINAHRDNITSFSFFTKKVKRLWTQYFISFIAMMIYHIWVIGYELTCNLVADTAIEMSFLHILLPAETVLNGISWYISAMLVLLPFLAYFLIHHERVFSMAIAPAVALCAYGYLLCGWGHVDFGLVWVGWINGGLIRAAGGLSAGVCLYYIAVRIPEIKRPNLVSVIELLIGAFVIVWSCFVRQTRMDLVEVLLLGVLIVLSFKNTDGWLAKATSNRVINYLGKISCSIYLNQLFVGTLTAAALSGTGLNTVWIAVIYIAVLIVASGFTNWIAELIDKRVEFKVNVIVCVGVFACVWIAALLFKYNISDYFTSPKSNIADSPDIHCSIDWCNDVSTLTANSYTISPEDETLYISGWAERISTNEPVDSVTAVCNGTQYTAELGLERSDVVENTGIDGLLYSGWQLVIPVADAAADEDGIIDITVSSDTETKVLQFAILNE
jgi:peptidoglycan/LPS O-acetylase OafA/YrhL